MLNNCEYFGNYFSIQSFQSTFVIEIFGEIKILLYWIFRENERENNNKSNRYVLKTWF